MGTPVLAGVETGERGWAVACGRGGSAGRDTGSGTGDAEMGFAASGCLLSLLKIAIVQASGR